MPNCFVHRTRCGACAEMWSLVTIRQDQHDLTLVYFFFISLWSFRIEGIFVEFPLRTRDFGGPKSSCDSVFCVDGHGSSRQRRRVQCTGARLELYDSQEMHRSRSNVGGRIVTAVGLLYPSLMYLSESALQYVLHCALVALAWFLVVWRSEDEPI